MTHSNQGRRPILTITHTRTPPRFLVSYERYINVDMLITITIIITVIEHLLSATIKCQTPINGAG